MRSDGDSDQGGRLAAVMVMRTDGCILGAEQNKQDIISGRPCTTLEVQASLMLR